jgi:uncharacterized protein YbjT (DUF2867 family)
MASTTILVTGGTGGLGRPVVEQLRAAEHQPRVLSRSTGGDLDTGAGLDAALVGVDTVLHLATSRGTKDSTQTRNLLAAAGSAGTVRHLVYISIVGVDEIPFPYYRDKVASERLIEESGIPFTILRATQFHDFIADFIRPLRRSPVLLALDVAAQPIAIDEVAARLVELASGAPQGRAPDIGGPEQLTVRECVDAWQRAHGTRKPVWTLRIPGRTIAAFKRGHHMPGLPGFGRRTFAQFAADDAERGTNRA